MTESGIQVRRAKPDEAEALTALIMRSKAHWGYDAAFLEASRPYLTLEPDIIARHPVYCAEDAQGRLAGVYHLYTLSDDEVCLDHLFIEPACIGAGVGSLLWRHAVALSVAQGAQALLFDADPNARAFYEHMGAVVVGWVDSSAIPGRRLPHMRYDLSSRASFAHSQR